MSEESKKMPMVKELLTQAWAEALAGPLVEALAEGALGKPGAKALAILREVIDLAEALAEATEAAAKSEGKTK